RFLLSLREHGLSPGFFFTDKDHAQINTIQSTWDPRGVRLCLWQLKRAVNDRLKERKPTATRYNHRVVAAEFPFVDAAFSPLSQPRSGQLCPVEHRGALLTMMDSHYHLHPMIPDARGVCKLSRAIWQDAAREMYDFCVANQLPDVWAYLITEWYR